MQGAKLSESQIKFVISDKFSAVRYFNSASTWFIGFVS